MRELRIVAAWHVSRMTASRSAKGVRAAVAGRKGTVAAKYGIGQSAFSTKHAALAAKSMKAQEGILRAHGLDGHIAKHIPGTPEHLTGLPSSDIAQMQCLKTFTN